MRKFTEQEFITQIRLMIKQKEELKYISRQTLEMMNSSVGWRKELRFLALDIINSTEEQFEMTYEEILMGIDKLGFFEGE